MNTTDRPMRTSQKRGWSVWVESARPRPQVPPTTRHCAPRWHVAETRHRAGGNRGESAKREASHEGHSGGAVQEGTQVGPVSGQPGPRSADPSVERALWEAAQGGGGWRGMAVLQHLCSAWCCGQASEDSNAVAEGS